MAGAQSTFTEAKAAEILRRLSSGEPLAQICRDEGMPCRDTVNNWRKSNPDFSADMERAREYGYDVIAAECLAIADDGSCDYTVGKDGLVVDSEHIQRSKLRVDTRLRLLAKWDSKRYGEKVEVGGKLSLESLVVASRKPEPDEAE